MKVVGNDIYLQLLTPEDVNQNYVNWMSDESITQFLESRWRVYTLGDLKQYVKDTNNGSTNFLFGIFLNSSQEYIGNIKIGNINQIHRYGDIGLLIGNKMTWGKGYGTEAIILASKYAFIELNLNLVTAGMYAPNIGSFRAFEKAGFSKVGILKKHYFYKGEFVDSYIMELSREEYLKKYTV